jgi:hypothetical protein
MTILSKNRNIKYIAIFLPFVLATRLNLNLKRITGKKKVICSIGKFKYPLTSFNISVLLHPSELYSQTCIKRSPLKQREKWPFKTGDLLEV